MTAPRLTLAVVLLVVASTVGVGATAAANGEWAAASAQVAVNETAPTMGANVSMFMQANAAQAEGSVENGMWVAAYARANDTSARQALIERRVGSMNASMAELRAERRALQAAYRNGTIDRVAYQARLSVVVGRLAALGEGIEETSVLGRAVGVNTTRLETLRSQARQLGGGEVSRIARNLTAGQGPPVGAGVFDDDRRGPPDERGPGEAANRSNRPTTTGDRGRPTETASGADRGQGQSTADQPGEGKGRDAERGQGPPSDDQGRSDGPPADDTPTPSPTPAD